MADNCSDGHLFHNHFNYAVIHQNVHARLDITGQVLERNAAYLIITENIISSQCVGVAGFNGDWLIIYKFAQPNLRSSGVHQCGNGQTQFFPQTGDLLKPLFVCGVVAVGKVKTSDIHARKHNLPHNGIVICRRSDRTNNLCLSHK